MKPEWLPDELVFSGGQVEDDYAHLFAIFERDFVSGEAVRIEQEEVIVNMTSDPITNGKYPFGFTHLVTKGKDTRAIDYDRATRLPWIKAILQNYDTPEVKAFWVDQEKGETLYLWLEDFDFVVILRRLKSKKYHKKIIVTAYFIYSYRRRDMQKLLLRAKKIL